MELKIQRPSFFPIFLLIIYSYTAFSQNVTARGNKALSVFQVIKFPNTACTASASSFNGTCYTSSECSNKGGTSSGTCANGFGVCCTFMVGCGSTASQNCTYFQVTSPIAGSCGTTICKCSPDICQLRLDFNTFVITGPSVDVANVVNTLQNGQPFAGGVPVTQATQCLTDTFTVTSPQGSSPPVICGTNTGQHMYVDASTSCNLLNFNLGTVAQGVTTIATRMWSIKVTQISCFDYTKLAPSGCTQYFTGETKTFQTYNYNAGTGAQLANQRQQICFRQESGFCRICYTAVNSIDFGVSGMAAAGDFTANTACCDYGTNGIKTKGFDCLMIPGASKNTANMAMSPASICGNGGGLVTVSGVINVSVCSKQTPFSVSFNSDNWSFVGATIRGFQLKYQQSRCT